MVQVRDILVSWSAWLLALVPGLGWLVDGHGVGLGDLTHVFDLVDALTRLRLGLPLLVCFCLL